MSDPMSKPMSDYFADRDARLEAERKRIAMLGWLAMRVAAVALISLTVAVVLMNPHHRLEAFLFCLAGDAAAVLVAIGLYVLRDDL